MKKEDLLHLQNRENMFPKALINDKRLRPYRCLSMFISQDPEGDMVGEIWEDGIGVETINIIERMPGNYEFRSPHFVKGRTFLIPPPFLCEDTGAVIGVCGTCVGQDVDGSVVLYMNTFQLPQPATPAIWNLATGLLMGFEDGVYNMFEIRVYESELLHCSWNTDL